ncbi:pyridoxamine 5'-phosphate oxidase family protein [Nocardia sp. CS682]|uniref:pyridoxamine 5'-phosphate oxidase family protein n=1 Tax=Nocardia sp. CS682 TaxID=1047172 RepID=UPI0010758CF5|nr:pyridoxamine 5'-phosphate oxidase family protein [Nocardia sp. CS682]QBS46303.1 pyridoxamine 5'-phosphate oxidase [Nocardia sp. CS682]
MAAGRRPRLPGEAVEPRFRRRPIAVAGGPARPALNRRQRGQTAIQPPEAPVWGWFTTGRRTRKARNLARDPHCAISIAAHDFDLTVNGTAAQVTDPAAVADVAARYAADGWPATVDDTGLALTAEYSAPSAGPPPWHVYRITVETAMALATVEPGGATRWRF